MHQVHSSSSSSAACFRTDRTATAVASSSDKTVTHHAVRLSIFRPVGLRFQVDLRLPYCPKHCVIGRCASATVSFDHKKYDKKWMKQKQTQAVASSRTHTESKLGAAEKRNRSRQRVHSKRLHREGPKGLQHWSNIHLFAHGHVTR